MLVYFFGSLRSPQASNSDLP